MALWKVRQKHKANYELQQNKSYISVEKAANATVYYFEQFADDINQKIEKNGGGIIISKNIEPKLKR